MFSFVPIKLRLTEQFVYDTFGGFMTEPIQRLIDTLRGTPIRYISGEYVGSTRTKCIFACDAGHTFERLWRTVVVSKTTNCPVCTGVRFNDQKMDQELQTEGYTRIGKYTNAQESLDVRCPKGHITSIRWSNFSRGHRCKICSDTKHSDISIDQELQKHGYHKRGQYIGIFERMQMTCPEGHLIEMAYNDFRKGSRCGDCYTQSRNDYEKAKQYAHTLGYTFLEESKSKSKISIQCPQGHVYSSTWGRFMGGTRCNVCSSSYWEQDFHEFLKSMNLEYRYRVHDIIDGEIDFLVGNLGIELHGSYFHSEKFISRRYHLDKHLKCKNAGIKLIQIFDYEWFSKTELYKDYIRSKLGIFEKRIHARDCTLDSDTDKQEVREFVEENHLQGYTSHLEAYTLRHKGEIVSCITISRHHRKSNELILNRLCSKRGYKVDGGFEKLFNSIPMKQGLITYADLRFTDGSIYTRLGFSEDGFLKPDYFYIRNGKKVTKQAMRKTPEERKTGMSEKDLRAMQGYLKVYDAGKIRFIYK
jgi:hypothetical protein